MIDLNALLANKLLVLALVVMWTIGVVLKHRVQRFDQQTWMWAIQLLLGQVAAFSADPSGFDWSGVLNGFGISLAALGGHGVGKGLLKAVLSMIKVV